MAKKSKTAKKVGRTQPRPTAKRFHVIAMVGDLHIERQPHWQVDFAYLDAAIRAADQTWSWIWTEWAHPEMQLRAEDICVFVYDPDHDELVDRPFYVRGNPAASE